MGKTIRLIATASALATAIAVAAPASAAPSYSLQTGADLAAVCSNPKDAKTLTDEERQRLGVCGAYIQGFLGHYSVSRRNMSKLDFCLPEEGVSAENVRMLFLALLEKRPQIRDLPANLDLATSLAWGYSCATGSAE